MISRVLPGKSFSLDGIPVNTLISLGIDAKKKSTTHVIYLCKPSLGNSCTVSEEPVILNGFCYYKTVICKSMGIVGIVFYVYTKKTYVCPYLLTVNKGCEDYEYSPTFSLEKIGLYIFTNQVGGVVVIPNILPTSNLLIQVS